MLKTIAFCAAILPVTAFAGTAPHTFSVDNDKALPGTVVAMNAQVCPVNWKPYLPNPTKQSAALSSESSLILARQQWPESSKNIYCEKLH